MKSLRTLILFILLCNLAGIIGSFFTFEAIPSWYVTLQKPSFSPPAWVFAPVWIILYTLMGVSAYLIWLKKGKRIKQALGVFAFQLILNTLWSIIFFGMRNPFIAFLEIILLWLSIIYCIHLFLKIEKRSAYLLIPYLLWVSFALILNLAIRLLNS